MASRMNDRWLWLGLGVFTVIAIKGVAHGLRNVVALTKVHRPLTNPSGERLCQRCLAQGFEVPNESQYCSRCGARPRDGTTYTAPDPATERQCLRCLQEGVDSRLLLGQFCTNCGTPYRHSLFFQDPPLPCAVHKQDAIKTSSLEVLASCDNVEIRKTATKMLCERFFAHPAARKRLLRDLASQDEDVLRRARLALEMLCENGVVHDAIYADLRSMEWELGELNGADHGRTLRHTAFSRAFGTDERDLRRRRREAMVINEGDRPVSQDDVWMRDRDGRLNHGSGLDSIRSDIETIQSAVRGLRTRM